MTSKYILKYYEMSTNSPKNEKMINTSLHLLENEIFSGSKNWSPTANWQYRQSEVLKGLSRYPPNTFTKSWAQVEQVWFAGGLNTANSSGWHLITRPLKGFSREHSTIEILTSALSKPWRKEYVYKDLADIATTSRNESSLGMVWSRHRKLREQDQWKDWIKRPPNDKMSDCIWKM